jgi:hypothetical protein
MDDARLTPNEQAEVRGAVMDIVKHGRFLVKATMLADIPEASLGGRFIADSINTVPPWLGSSVVHLSHQAIQIGLLAGLDNIAGFASLIKVSSPSAPALASVARASLEVLARSNWMLKPREARGLVDRYCALTIGDLYFPALYRQKLGTVSAEGLTASDLRDQIRDWAAKNLADLPQVPRLAAMTAVLVDDVFSDAIKLADHGAEVVGTYGDQYYSQLSAIAHGQSLAINMFLQVDLLNPFENASPANISMEAPRALALGDAQALIQSAIYVISHLAAVMEPPTNTEERWREACGRSATRIALLGDARPYDYPAWDL